MSRELFYIEQPNVTQTSIETGILYSLAGFDITGYFRSKVIAINA